MEDQLQVLGEILGIVLGVLMDVEKCMVERCSGLEYRYHVVNVRKGSRPDGCCFLRRAGSVRHRCLDGVSLGCIRTLSLNGFDFTMDVVGRT